MNNSVISEGKTTQEAIDNGLKILNVSKEKVDVKILENENKKNFFSILTPRIVKVQLTIKEKSNKEEKIEIKEERAKREYDYNKEDICIAKERIEEFLKVWLQKVDNTLEYTIKEDNYTIYVDIKGNAAGTLIGYRGETLNSMQTILSTIANRGFNSKIRLILDIENYRQKREKTLEELAEKVSKTVLKTGKSITLEPMSAYERKIIHSKLQDSNKIETYSIGEGDNRRVVISKIR